MKRKTSASKWAEIKYCNIYRTQALQGGEGVQQDWGLGEEEADLVEGFLQVIPRGVPGGNCVTKEHEVLEHAARIDTDHGTDPTESRVLLFVVTNGAQRLTPHGQELGQEGGHLRWADQPQPADGDCRVLQECLGRVLPIDVLN